MPLLTPDVLLCWAIAFHATLGLYASARHGAAWRALAYAGLAGALSCLQSRFLLPGTAVPPGAVLAFLAGPGLFAALAVLLAPAPRGEG